MSNPTKHVINVSKIKQLVDLNQHFTNFNLKFNAVSQNQDDFYAAVVDQTTLDSLSDSEIDYKLANGSLSGSVSSDKNIYQNHFLILKSDNPTIVEVEVNAIELPKKIQHAQQHAQQQGSLQKLRQESLQKHSQENSGFFSNKRKLFLYVLIAIAFGVIVYVLFFRTKKPSELIKPYPHLSREALQTPTLMIKEPVLGFAYPNVSSKAASASSKASSVSSKASSVSSNASSKVSSKASDISSLRSSAKSESSRSESSRSESSNASSRSGKLKPDLINKLKAISLS
jgi:hypothetical protein